MCLLTFHSDPIEAAGLILQDTLTAGEDDISQQQLHNYTIRLPSESDYILGVADLSG